MERPVREIPGYYYGFCHFSCLSRDAHISIDIEKKKYFKIQPSGAAPPSSAYSQQDVKKRKLNDKKAESRALAVARERRRINRSKILLEPLAGGLLARENGYGGLDASEILAGGLVSQGYISAMMQFSSCSAPLFAFGHRPDLGPSISDLWIGEFPFSKSWAHIRLKIVYIFCLFCPNRPSLVSCPLFIILAGSSSTLNLSIVYDDQLFTLRVNSDKHARSTNHGCVEICHDFSVPTTNNAIWRIERFGHSGTSTSISTNETSRRLAMTWLATSAQAGIAVTAMAGIGELGIFLIYLPKLLAP